MPKPRWTHTAILTSAVRIGPEQMNVIAHAGETVELWQDPTAQAGELISIRLGHHTGAARLSSLRNVAAKEAGK